MGDVTGDFRHLELVTEDEEDRLRMMDPLSAAAYQLISDYATDLISVHSLDGRYAFASPACKRMLGYSQGEMIGMNLYRMFHPDDIDLAMLAEKQLIGTDDSDHPSVTYRMKCKNGSYRWVETTSRMHVTKDNLKKIIAVTRDVSQRELLVKQLEFANEKLTEIALTDELTGIPNRRSFNERLESLMPDVVHGRMLSLVLCDIDNFKTFNDTFGHQAGDEIIIMVAKSLTSICRKIDLVARHGGEEFSILMPGTNSEGAAASAERMREAIEKMIIPYGKITMSFGICDAIKNSSSSSALFSGADKALYVAKANGRNRVEIYDHHVTMKIV